MNLDTLEKLVVTDGLNVCLDSRLVKPGDVFVAVKGIRFDGHHFIEQALAAGAGFVVVKDSSINNDRAVVVKETAHAAGVLAQACYGYPSRRLVNLAVTGTNGKTTVAYLVRSIIRSAGGKCGLIGTVVYDTGQSCRPAPLTTPGPLELACEQRKMVDCGASCMVIEASSHALVQNRLAGIDFRSAAFTNLAAEHLDYHRDMRQYLAAKALLFECLGPEALAVLNADSLHASRIAARSTAPSLWYTVEGEKGDLSAQIESAGIFGTIFMMRHGGRSIRVSSRLCGRYNVSNSLAAAGLCLAAGLDLEQIAVGLSAADEVPGRLEWLKGDGFSVVIDYAHTSDAMRKVLSELRNLCSGRLHVVFGCGGDRDRAKRPRMGRVAERLADLVYVTSDNPRGEDPAAIIQEILSGVHRCRDSAFVTEPDRKKAIGLAIGRAAPGDIVLIAGKGHETYQIVGDDRLPFSDREIALGYLGGTR